MDPENLLSTSVEEALLDANLRALLALEAEAPEPDVLGRLAAAWNARAFYRRALDAAVHGLESDPSHGDLWWERIRAVSSLEDGELEELVSPLIGIQEKSPDDPAAARNLGLLHYYLGEDDLCRRWCNTALELDAEDSRAHEVLAYMHFSQDDLTSAIEACAQAVEIDPRNHRAYHWLGECYLRSDAPEPAERYLLRALEEEEYDVLALTSLAEHYLGDHETIPWAIQCFSRMLSVNPTNWLVYQRFIEFYLQEGRHLEALAQCMQLLDLEPDSRTRADAWQYVGLIQYMEGNDEEAEEAFEEAIGADPEFPAAWHYLGLLAERAGENEHAEEMYRRALECDGDYAFSLVRLGYLFFDRGDNESAMRFFRRALEADPDEYMAHLGISEVMRVKDRLEEQLEHVQAAHDIAPTDGNVLNQLGIAYESLERVEEAVEAYRTALRADPHNRQAANNLGYLLERRLAEAEDEDDRDRLRREAIEAWKRRLLICRDEEVSTQGARRHLRDLGVGIGLIEEWLVGEEVEDHHPDEAVH